MSIAVILLQQLVIMALLMAAGYLMFKGKKISLEGSRSLANILIYLCLPCVIIKGFLVEQTLQATIGLLISAVAAAVTLGTAILISRIFFSTLSTQSSTAATAFSAASRTPVCPTMSQLA